MDEVVNIFVLQFSDGGGPLIYVNGEWKESLRNVGNLSLFLKGKTVKDTFELWIEPEDEDEPEPWWDLSYFDSLSDLYLHIYEYPQLVTDSDYSKLFWQPNSVQETVERMGRSQ